MNSLVPSVRDEFWVRVNAALDAHRDPLEEPEVQRLLTDEPALLGQLATLRAGLGLLERRRRSRAAFRAAAALLVAALGLAWGWSATRTVASAPPVQVASGAVLVESVGARAVEPPRSPPASRVLAFRAEVTVEGPRGRRTTTFDGERLIVSSAGHAAEDEAALQIPFFVATVDSVPASR